MTRIAADAKRQGMEATGPNKVNKVYEWLDTPTGRKKSDQQAIDPETGFLQFEVEVEYDELVYGNEETAIVKVQVGAAEKPEPKRHSPITFRDLYVDIRFNRKTGQETQRWYASEIDKMTPASPSTSSQAPASSDSKAA